ncbi:MAG: SapC family protein [Deltaproteobacteria bacterium]|nr:SapC family protein [Deltaproteobacteria bacterium]
MFVATEPLNRELHKGLRFKPMANLKFAEKVSQVPLSYSEVVKAGRYYPIVFPLGGAMIPHAVLSLRKNHNSYLSPDGKWMVPYIPMHIMRYPFVLGTSTMAQAADAAPEAETNFIVCIDRQAENFKGNEGTELFTESGEPTESTAKAIDFLKKFKMELDVTEKLFGLLAEHDCLVKKQLTMDVDGAAQSAGAFQVADLSKIKDLDGAVLKEWAANGLLGLIYAQNFSLANLDRFADQLSKAKN